MLMRWLSGRICYQKSVNVDQNFAGLLFNCPYLFSIGAEPGICISFIEPRRSVKTILQGNKARAGGKERMLEMGLLQMK